jgi:hypothetical protein
MIRLTLRQFRAEGVTSIGLLAVLAIVLAVTGMNVAHVNDAFEAACKAARDCSSAVNPVVGVDKALQAALQAVVVILPALAGLFLGAPLIARELETGTFRLAWTQSVTRRRWLAVKLGLIGLTCMALGGLATLMVSWWASPMNAVYANRFGILNFGFYGVAPVGYAAFAFALGVTAGVLLRRTIPAMAVTLAGFAAARLAVTFWVRPYLAPPAHESLSLSAGQGAGIVVHSPGDAILITPPQVSMPDAWVYSVRVVDRSGDVPTSQYLAHACPALGGLARPTAQGGGAGQPGSGPLTSKGSVPVPALQACLGKLSASLHTVVTYQPASRFWPFQWAEAGIFVAAALALCGLSCWWLRRRYA